MSGDVASGETRFTSGDAAIGGGGGGFGGDSETRLTSGDATGGATAAARFTSDGGAAATISSGSPLQTANSDAGAAAGAAASSLAAAGAPSGRRYGRHRRGAAALESSGEAAPYCCHGFVSRFALSCTRGRVLYARRRGRVSSGYLEFPSTELPS